MLTTSFGIKMPFFVSYPHIFVLTAIIILKKMHENQEEKTIVTFLVLPLQCKNPTTATKCIFIVKSKSIDSIPISRSCSSLKFQY